MKAIVAGGRKLSVTDSAIAGVMDLLRKMNVTEVVSGGASGGDQIGEIAARRMEIPVTCFAAEWDYHKQEPCLSCSIWSIINAYGEASEEPKRAEIWEISGSRAARIVESWRSLAVQMRLRWRESGRIEQADPSEVSGPQLWLPRVKKDGGSFWKEIWEADGNRLRVSVGGEKDQAQVRLLAVPVRLREREVGRRNKLGAWKHYVLWLRSNSQGRPCGKEDDFQALQDLREEEWTPIYAFVSGCGCARLASMHVLWSHSVKCGVPEGREDGVKDQVFLQRDRQDRQFEGVYKRKLRAMLPPLQRGEEVENAGGVFVLGQGDSSVQKSMKCVFRGAGPVRNEQMAEYVGPKGACILLPGGAGTADMERRAREHGLLIMQVELIHEKSETAKMYGRKVSK